MSLQHAIIASPGVDSRLAYLKKLLHSPDTNLTTGTHPLAAFLLLIDVAAELRTLNNLDNDQLNPALDQPTADQVRSERWTRWTTYLQAMYRAPTHAGVSPLPIHASTASIDHWHSPAGDKHFDPSLTPHQSLRSCCIDCIKFLVAPTEDPLTVLDALLANDSSFPQALPSGVLDNISTRLRSSQHDNDDDDDDNSSADAPANRVACASAVAIVLNAHFGQAFGETIDAEGNVKYAIDEEDDQAIRRILACSLSKRGQPDELDEDEDDASRTEALSPLQAAERSITKRDDKMRWLFGDDYQKGNAALNAPDTSKRRSLLKSSHHSKSDKSPANTNSTTATHKGFRTVSLASVDSKSPASPHHRYSATSWSSSHRIEVARSHQRVESTASSNAPLVGAQEAARRVIHDEQASDSGSPSSTRTLFHRRHASAAQAVPALALPPLQPLSPQAPFQNLLDPSSLVSSSDSVDSPRTENTLTRAERRDLMRKSRKLERLLGVPIQEAAVSTILYPGVVVDAKAACDLTSPSAGPRFLDESSHSDSSTPLNDPNKGHINLNLSPRRWTPTASASGTPTPLTPNSGPRRMSRSLSVPSMSQTPSPTPSPTDAYFTNIPNARAFAALGGTAAQQREERRRKLAKLQRVLGEHVPYETALSDKPGMIRNHGGSVGGGHRANKLKSGFGGKLAGAFGIHHHHTSIDSATAGISEEKTIIIDPCLPNAYPGKHPKKLPIVQDLQKARKLENMFGDLPPRSLYLSRASQDLATGPPRHRRQSDMSSMTAHTSSVRTIDSYRASIASLQHLADEDPVTLSRVVAQTYAAGSAATRSDPALVSGEMDLISTCPPPSFSDPFGSHEGATVTARPRCVTPSAASATKRATKLSHFFGTTRGAVWSMLLDDLQAAVEDESDLDEDEKDEVAESIERLRETTRM